VCGVYFTSVAAVVNIHFSGETKAGVELFMCCKTKAVLSGKTNSILLF
jgi:hypothetical protein